MSEQNDKKRVRSTVEEVEPDLPEVKRLRENLLDSFEEEDDDICTTSEDLDSFMKIFESEIIQTPDSILDSTLTSEESKLDLGFLLEASDDELGLPVSTVAGEEEEVEVAELVRVPSDSDGLSELWEFEDRMMSFGEFEVGVGSEYVALDGLFDYGDLGFGPGDFGFGFQPETLPAQ